MSPESRYLRMWSIVPVSSPDKQEKAAARKNKKQAAKAPLFAHAGLLTPTTPGQVLTSEVGHRRRRSAGECHLYARGFRFRWELARSGLVSRGDLRHLDERYWASHLATKNVGYFADYWRKQCKERGVCVS